MDSKPISGGILDDSAGDHLQLAARTPRDSGVVGDENNRPTTARKFSEKIQDGGVAASSLPAARRPRADRAQTSARAIATRCCCPPDNSVEPFFSSRQSDGTEKTSNVQAPGRRV